MSLDIDLNIDFKSEKLIEIKEGKIILLEEKKLTNLFN